MEYEKRKFAGPWEIYKLQKKNMYKQYIDFIIMAIIFPPRLRYSFLDPSHRLECFQLFHFL